jgi:hypothetical protein
LAFSAAFNKGTGTSCPPAVTVGNCAYYACGNGQPTPTTDNAGTISLTGPGLPSPTTVTLSSGAGYYSYSSSVAKLVPGATYTASATGGTVPAFGPLSIVAPPAVVLGLPAATNGAYTIPTSQDLTLAWKGGVSGDIFLVEGVTTSAGTYFTCEIDATMGKWPVPQAVLAPLKGQSGYFLYGQLSQANYTVGAYPIAMYALPYTGGNATFQ